MSERLTDEELGGLEHRLRTNFLRRGEVRAIIAEAKRRGAGWNEAKAALRKIMERHCARSCECPGCLAARRVLGVGK